MCGVVNLKYQENISVQDYQFLRKSVNWEMIPDCQAEASLRNSAYVVSCYDADIIVGTARVMWDMGYTAFIVDVIVRSEYQRKAYGSKMIEMIMHYLKAQIKDDEKMMVNLYSARGKEPFYIRHGFIWGSGMYQWIGKNIKTIMDK